MPYKRVGRRIYTKRTGRWRLKQTARSVRNAKRTMGLLHGVERGWRPTRRKK